MKIAPVIIAAMSLSLVMTESACRVKTKKRAESLPVNTKDHLQTKGVAEDTLERQVDPDSTDYYCPPCGRG